MARAASVALSSYSSQRCLSFITQFCTHILAGAQILASPKTRRVVVQIDSKRMFPGIMGVISVELIW